MQTKWREGGLITVLYGNITAGFRVTGIYPFNHDMIMPTQLQPIESSSTSSSSGLTFLPFSGEMSRSSMGSEDIMSPDDKRSAPTESADAGMVRSPVISEVVSRRSPEMSVSRGSSIDSRRSSVTSETGGEFTCSPGPANMLQHSVLDNVLSKQASKIRYPLKIPKTSARILTSVNIADDGRKREKQEAKERCKAEREKKKAEKLARSMYMYINNVISNMYTVTK